MSFDEISLTRSELKVLQELAKSSIGVDDCIRSDIDRLVHYGFAETRVYTGPVEFKSSSFIPKAASITDEGRDYLAYLHAKRRSKWKDRAYGFISGVAITVIAQLIYGAAAG